MSDTETIRTEIRQEFGSAASRRMRKTGMVPCLVYSSGKEADALSIEVGALTKAISLPHVIQLDVNGKTKNVLTQEAQWDYLADVLLHVDFKEIRMDQKIKTHVPITATGEAPGVAAGGSLDQATFEIEVECLPSNIPEKIEIDVSTLEIGDSVLISTVPMPEGVEAIFSDESQSLFQVSAPRAEEEEAEVAEEEGAEGDEGEASAEDAPETE